MPSDIVNTIRKMVYAVCCKKYTKPYEFRVWSKRYVRNMSKNKCLTLYGYSNVFSCSSDLRLKGNYG